MRLLADECIPAPIVHRLRAEGFDVAYVLEDDPGTDDPDVLDRERRLLLTEDRDFGQLVYAKRRPAPFGVVYLRLHGVTLDDAIEAVVRVLTSETELAGWFTTVDGSDRVRQRRLP